MSVKRASYLECDICGIKGSSSTSRSDSEIHITAKEAGWKYEKICVEVLDLHFCQNCSKVAMTCQVCGRVTLDPYKHFCLACGSENR